MAAPVLFLSVPITDPEFYEITSNEPLGALFPEQKVREEKGDLIERVDGAGFSEWRLFAGNRLLVARRWAEPRVLPAARRGLCEALGQGKGACEEPVEATHPYCLAHAPRPMTADRSVAFWPTRRA